MNIEDVIKDRILVLDGAMGTMIQSFRQHTFSVIADFENEFLCMGFYLDAL